MPVPVVLVDADLFAEITQLVLDVRVIRRKVGWYVDGYLQVYKRTGCILQFMVHLRNRIQVLVV